MLCRSCYHEIPAGSLFCPRCRARQAEPAAEPAPAAPALPAPPAGAPAPAPANPWEERGSRSWFEAFGETLQRVLFHPAAFFRGTAPDRGGRPALLFSAVAVTLSLAVAALWGRALETQFDWVVRGVHFQERFPPLLHWLLWTPLLTVIAVVSIAALSHLGLALVGAARGGFTATLKAVAYASAGLAFAAFPFLGPLVGVVWAGVLQVIGFSELHRTSRGRAAFGCALPLLIGFAIVMATSLLVALGLMKAWDAFGGRIDV